MRRIPALLVVSLICLQAQAASFDCAKAHSVFERFICGAEVENSNLPESLRPELVGLDAELNTVYWQAKTQYFDPALLRDAQRAWLKARDRCIRDEERGCFLTGLYRDRINDLRYDMAHPAKTPKEQKLARLLSMGSPPGNNFVFDMAYQLGSGQGFGLCEALVRWLNHLAPVGNLDGNIPYYRSLLDNIPGVSEPAWQELDMQQHKELFTKLAQVSFNEYSTPVSVLRETIRAGHAGAYRLWMVREDVDGDKKPETFVRWTHKTKPWRGGPLIVTDDLSDVDIQKSRNEFLITAPPDFLYYKGRPVFVKVWPSGAAIHGIDQWCEFHNFKSEGSKK